MRVTLFLAVLTSVLFLIQPCFSLSAIDAPPSQKLTLYGSIGDTQDTPNLGQGSHSNYNLGGQFTWISGKSFIFNYGYGIDLGYSQLYEIKSSTGQQKINYLKSLALVEGTAGFFMMQFGAGAYWGIGNNSRVDGGIMAAFGFTFPASFLSIQALGRTEWIFAENTTFSVGFLMGLAFHFDI